MKKLLLLTIMALATISSFGQNISYGMSSLLDATTGIYSNAIGAGSAYSIYHSVIKEDLKVRTTYKLLSSIEKHLNEHLLNNRMLKGNEAREQSTIIFLAGIKEEINRYEVIIAGIDTVIITAALLDAYMNELKVINHWLGSFRDDGDDDYKGYAKTSYHKNKAYIRNKLLECSKNAK
jgi:hypothetical protein